MRFQLLILFTKVQEGWYFLHTTHSFLKELRQKADEKAKAEAAELSATTENKRASLRARAEERIDKAAQLVVERIVNS